MRAIGALGALTAALVLTLAVAAPAPAAKVKRCKGFTYEVPVRNAADEEWRAKRIRVRGVSCRRARRTIRTFFRGAAADDQSIRGFFCRSNGTSVARCSARRARIHFRYRLDE